MEIVVDLLIIFFYKRYYHDALIDLEYSWLDFYFQLSIN